MKYLKKLVSGACISVCSIFFINKVDAVDYKLLLSAPSFGQVQIVGKADDKIDFVYYSERFYDKYKDLYVKKFCSNKFVSIEGNKYLYDTIKLNGGPGSDLSATKISLCEEIDPHRGIRDEGDDDENFLSQYFEMDENLADILNEYLKATN